MIFCNKPIPNNSEFAYVKKEKKKKKKKKKKKLKWAEFWKKNFFLLFFKIPIIW